MPNNKRRGTYGDQKRVNSLVQELSRGDDSFTLISLMPKSWIKPCSTTKMISLNVCLPSGVQKFSIRPVDDGNYLGLEKKRPGPSVDFEWLFRKFLSSEISLNEDKNTIFNGSIPFKNIGSSSCISKFLLAFIRNYLRRYSNARVSLPFQCQPTIEKSNFTHKDYNSLVVVCESQPL